MRLIWKKLTAIYVVATIIFILGLTVGILWSSLYTSMLNKELVLSPTSTNYGLWKETPIPMYLKLYMFNWTNPSDLNTSCNIKPHFVEMGPYIFRQVDYKVNQTWNENNNTITYLRKRIWHFDESLSNGSLSDMVTNLNPVATSVAYTFKYKQPFVRDVIDRIMRILGQKITVTRTVRELLFDGYNDTMLVIAKKLNISEMPFTKFGWFYGRNGSATYDGTFNMLTGASGLSDLGMLKEWNFRNSTDYYDGECGAIKGSNGDLWPPLKNNETVDVFVSDICTNLRLVYGNTTRHLGILGTKYISDETMLDNGMKVPSRECYHKKGTDYLPSGMLDVSRCKWDAPAFVSLPHFYLADPSYRENITGMKPDRNKHETSILLEPNTGVPLQVKAQLQLNMLVQPDNAMAIFKNVTHPRFIPMLWFTQEAALTEDFAGKVKLIMILESLGAVTGFGVAAIGILIFFIGMFICIRHKWRGEETQVLLPRNDVYDVSIT